MRSIKFSLSAKPTNAWTGAVLLVEAYFTAGLKADQVLDLLPEDFIGQRRASCQSLFLGALRHGHRSRAAYNSLLRKSPKPLVEAILLVAGFEFLSEPAEKHPKIVHYTVEQSKSLVRRHEQGFLNAVLRKLPQALQKIDPAASPADYYSHPKWLVDHWMMTIGSEETLSLLRWNQQIPEKTIRIYGSTEALPGFLTATEWPEFYTISRTANWLDQVIPLLETGSAYIKDPSTRLAPALLAPSPGSDVLDLCAAPGGKSFDLAHHMKHQGRLASVDLPGARAERLRENLSGLSSGDLESRMVECDILELSAEDFNKNNLPAVYDAVMLDAPCSNTGVIQRRTDVKWRLQPKDIPACAKLQLELLSAAARFVKTGGRLVYSTCSIEEQENRDVVERFLQTPEGQCFESRESVVSLPWVTGHDGAGAYLLVRKN